jgi:hypothetical protein
MTSLDIFESQCKALDNQFPLNQVIILLKFYWELHDGGFPL